MDRLWDEAADGEETSRLQTDAILLPLWIAQAQEMLELTNAPVTEIAFDVGYESSQALARLFWRDVGISPGDYRRMSKV